MWLFFIALKGNMMNEQLEAKQLELEQLHNKNQTLSRIRAEFIESKEVPFLEYFKHIGLPEGFCLDLLVQMSLHKRTDVGTLVGLLHRHFGNMQECADALLKAAEANLVDYESSLDVFIVKFDISQDVQEDLDRFQYPLPMIVEPRKLVSNSSSAYMLTMGSVILKNNHHNEDVCLDHLNRMNKIPLNINMDVVKKMKNSWKDLDKRKEGETDTDFKKRQKAFAKYDRTAKEVMEKVTEFTNTVYLTHKVDKRGRTYSCGYHFNPMGNAWNKATVLLANKEVIE